MMNIFNLAKKYLHSIDIKEPSRLFKVRDKEKCLARIWDKGEYGNTQCQKMKFKCFLCKKHYNASLRMNGQWWLGLINEERPENPIHPISGQHNWSKDKNGNEYVKEEIQKEPQKEKEVKEKRRRGRPKGSKNKIK